MHRPTMTLSQHYQAVQALSPKAARMAARLLDRSMNIPYEWRVSLRLALADRSRNAGALTATDLAPLNTVGTGPGHRAHAKEQATEFMMAVQSDVGEDRGS